MVKDFPLKVMLFVYIIYYFVGLFILCLENNKFYSLAVFSVYTFFLVLGYYMGKIIFLSSNSTFTPVKRKIISSDNSYVVFQKFYIILYFLALFASIWCCRNKLYELGEIFKLVVVIIIVIFFWLYLVKRISFLKFFLLLIIYMTINIYLGGRHGIMELLIILIFLYSLYKPIKFKLFFVFTLIGILIMIIGGIFKLYHANKVFPQIYAFSFWEFIFHKAIINRVIMIGAKTINYIINEWEWHHNLFYGLTFIKRILAFLNIKKIPNLGYLIYEEVTGYYGGYDPISLIGDFYVNFSIYGIFLIMPVGVFFGFILSYLKQKIYLNFFINNALFTYSLIYAYLSYLLVRTFTYSLAGLIASILEFIIVLSILIFINKIFYEILKK